MQVYVGDNSIGITYQNTFETSIKCDCGGSAHIACVVDDDQGEISKLREVNGFNEEELWIHDSCAIAVYFCKRCMSCITLYNQATEKN
jgi:hypothetical protein